MMMMRILQLLGIREKTRMDSPPYDDCCPICFSNFLVPCRGPCGHWYCGGCILQYWKYSPALQPCNCPMCSKQITKLTPEASLHRSREAEVTEVLRKIRKYNRHHFVGSRFGFMIEVFGLPLLYAMFLGLLYIAGCQNIGFVFQISAAPFSMLMYLERKHFEHVMEMEDVDP